MPLYSCRVVSLLLGWSFRIRAGQSFASQVERNTINSLEKSDAIFKTLLIRPEIAQLHFVLLRSSGVLCRKAQSRADFGRYCLGGNMMSSADSVARTAQPSLPPRQATRRSKTFLPTQAILSNPSSSYYEDFYHSRRQLPGWLCFCWCAQGQVAQGSAC